VSPPGFGKGFVIVKYAILVGDGMADFSLPELDNRTPLEYAATPNMDAVAKAGRVGLVKTIPEGLTPGSDVANMSLLGYDAAQYYSGRAPIEAASMGIRLGPGEVAFRCNLVTLNEGIMADYSAGHIETADAHIVIAALQSALQSPTVRFYPGVSYRHLVVLSRFPDGRLDCTPPHDISGRPIDGYLPKGEGEIQVREMMDRASAVLASCDINKQRVAAGKKPVTDIWLWGQGKALALPSMHARFGITGSVVSAVDLVRGIGVLAGLNVRIVPGATGYLGTNYAGKTAAARDALAHEDFVFVHIEAPDETSHEGALEKKIQAIEEFDKNIVGEVLRFRAEFPDLRIMVLPDHATPIPLKTHHAGPVPFTVCGSNVAPDTSVSYCEKAAIGKKTYTGVTLFETFIKGKFE
jgi:2,3-bisphosphoglycerate-independent phosphoglycerate mutase